MSREIRFRAWDQETKEMSYDFLSKNWLKVCIESPYVVLMQYTGLKDRNGMDIYEGDILENGSFIYWVVFFEEASFKVKFPNPINTSRYTLTRDAAEMREVIGNIYENFELLEG